MTDLDTIRSDGEEEIAAILASLDERHKVLLRDALRLYGSVENIPLDVWGKIQGDTEEEAAAVLLLLMLSGAGYTATEIESQGGRTKRPDLGRMSLLAARQASNAASTSIVGLQKRITRELEQARLDQTLGDIGDLTQEGIDAALEKALDAARRKALATDQTTEALTTGQREAAGGAGTTNAAGQRVTVEMRWQTERDNRVCFPAGTMIATDGGQKPIEKVVAGDMVLTRMGYCRVTEAFSRPYSGRLSTVFADGVAVTATEDHPFFTLEKEWVAASNLNSNLTLYGLGDKPLQVRRVVNFKLRESNDFPSIALQECGFSGISGGVAMPIGSVNLNSDLAGHDRKIDRVPTDAILLDGGNSDRSQRPSNKRLRERLAPESAITRRTTELANRIAWTVSHRLAAASTLNGVNWAPAFFGAEPAVQMLLGPKSLATSLAVDVLRLSTSAGGAAHIKAVSNRRFDRKCISANAASLCSFLGVGKSARSRAATIATILCPCWGKVERPAAMLANSCFARALASLRGKFQLFKRKWHAGLYQKSTVVYDLRVDECHEFFANGVLVHNCPRCGPLHETPEEVWSKVFYDGPGVAAHPNCRCWLRAVVVVEELKPEDA